MLLLTAGKLSGTKNVALLLLNQPPAGAGEIHR
jgi:hypothetical protein